MKKAIWFIIILIFIAGCRNDNKTKSKTWTLATGIKIVKENDNLEPMGIASYSWEIKGAVLNICIKDYYYESGNIDNPWLSIDRNGMATLNYGSPGKNKLFTTKDEYYKEACINIAPERIKDIKRIYLSNTDTQEVIGHIDIK